MRVARRPGLPAQEEAGDRRDRVPWTRGMVVRPGDPGPASEEDVQPRGRPGASGLAVWLSWVQQFPPHSVTKTPGLSDIQRDQQPALLFP